MGTQEPNLIDSQAQGAGATDKAVLNVDTQIASSTDEDFNKGYVDPKEERAFVSPQSSYSEM